VARSQARIRAAGKIVAAKSAKAAEERKTHEKLQLRKCMRARQSWVPECGGSRVIPCNLRVAANAAKRRAALAMQCARRDPGFRGTDVGITDPLTLPAATPAPQPLPPPMVLPPLPIARRPLQQHGPLPPAAAALPPAPPVRGLAGQHAASGPPGASSRALSAPAR
jgi:hypothetical protein